MNKALKDHGPKPFVVDVEKLTIDNKNYRTVIWTGKYMQMTVMSIPPGGDIGLEIHKDHDQFLRIEKGEGIVQMGDAEDNLDFQEKVGDDFAILIPAGKWHNLVNNGTEPLKLYSIYSPVEHPKNTVHKTKQSELTKHYNGGKLNNHTNINMKFNKEKTKKFQQGGKTPKEIMEEARRNQAIWQQQREADISAAIARDAANTAARDAVYNSGIPAYQSPPVIIQDPRSVVLDKINPDRGTYTMGNSNLPEVVIWGKGPRPKQRPTSTAAPTRELPPETEVVIPRIINEEDSTRVVTDQPPLELILNSDLENRGRDWSQEQAPNRDPGSIYANHRPKRIDWGWIRRKWNGLNQGSILYQQGGQLPLRSGLERFFRIEPGYTPVNSQESITRYIDNTRKGPVEKRVIRKEVPYANLYSTMSIFNPGTNRADTTVTTPEGITYNMNDVRSGKAPSGYGYKFFEKPTGYFQQGGTLDNEETGSTDQLYVDFAIRYLKAKGVSEDNMVDSEGGLKDEFLEEISTAINEVDSPDFWEQYQANPDEVIQSYIESKMDPAQIEMARKGAKLKKLKKGGMKSRKCKCGCNLTMKKEAGGKIKEVCACGCKK